MKRNGKLQFSTVQFSNVQGAILENVKTLVPKNSRNRWVLLWSIMMIHSNERCRKAASFDYFKNYKHLSTRHVVNTYRLFKELWRIKSYLCITRISIIINYLHCILFTLFHKWPQKLENEYKEMTQSVILHWVVFLTSVYQMNRNKTEVIESSN